MKRSWLGRDQRWLALLFFALTMATGIRVALLTPIGQVADEPAHIARAAALLHGELFGLRVPFTPPGKVTLVVPATRVDLGLLHASIEEMGASCADRAIAARTAALGWTKARIIDIDYNTIQYFPALYLPGTIGIGLGRAVGERPLAALLTGRLSMLLAYAVVGAFAIAIARFGRAVLFAVLSLPMALSLGASFNQDGLLIALSALGGALLTLDPARYPRGRWWFLPIFTLVIASKPPYGLLLFAALAPLAAPGVLRRCLMIALWAVPPLVWVLLMARFSLLPYHLKPYHPGPLWPGSDAVIFHATDPIAGLRVLLANPRHLLGLPIRFVVGNAGFLVKSGIGELGWLTVDLARPVYLGWEIALIVAAMGVLVEPGRDGIEWSGRDALFVLVLVVVSVWAVEIAVYLSWDRVGSAAIYGPQGRYYLLFLPFLMLALPRGGRFALPGWVWAVPAIGMAGFDVVYLPALLARRFCLG